MVPVLNFEEIGKDGNYNAPFTYTLTKFNIHRIGKTEWDGLRWTRHIPVDVKNAHRKAWGMEPLPFDVYFAVFKLPGNPETIRCLHVCGRVYRKQCPPFAVDLNYRSAYWLMRSYYEIDRRAIVEFMGHFQGCMSGEMQPALLVSYDTTTGAVSGLRIIEVSHGHDWARGPYSSSVNYVVGSNQSVAPIEEFEFYAKKAYLKS